MSDFSLELEAERIVDRRSRVYFREVYGCYTAGNFRSAVVMLWSVVVCDLLFKLDELRDAYSDPTATGILDDVKEMQRSAPTSPQWELELIKRVQSQTDLLDVGEGDGLIALQRQRHISAHPVLTTSYELYSPSREAARAGIRLALEAVLTKPSFMTKKVFNALMDDLEVVRDTFPKETSFRQWLRAKYLSKLRKPAADDIFRRLWRVTFKVEDERAEANRDVNLRALLALGDGRQADAVVLVGADRDYYSTVSTRESALGALVSLLGDHPRLFELLTDAAKAPLHAYAEVDDRHALFWFLEPSMERHLAALQALIESAAVKLTSDTFDVLYDACPAEQKQTARLLAVEAYVRCDNFGDAIAAFALVGNHLDDFGEPELLQLLDRAERNDQVYRRAHARRDHRLLKAACARVLGTGFDASKYPNIVASWG